jgi:D-glycero-alpha-D-manno-heptose-7-phosphate kinase
MPPKMKLSEAPVRVAVPNRVDLAGGTLDIYPLCLLVPGAMTVNAAITVQSLVEVRPARGPARLVSGNFPVREEAGDTHGFRTKGALGLIASALRFFPPCRGVEFHFRNEAPVGSGLGASSSLLVAVMLAMDAWLGSRRRWEETARAAMEIEASHLRTLTGCQDHVAALRGGIQSICFLPGRLDATRISPAAGAARMLAAHGFLAATGTAHHSGRVNWGMVRGAIDGDAAVLRKFAGIAAAARDVWDAVAAGEAALAGRVIGREWMIRRTLAPGVSLPRVDRVFAVKAFRAAVAGAKLCGAGGGGMIFGILRDPGARRNVESFLGSHGFAPLPFRISGGPIVARRPDDR